MSKNEGNRLPNDNRSDVKNPNNAVYEADMANRKKLGHDASIPPPPEGKKD